MFTSHKVMSPPGFGIPGFQAVDQRQSVFTSPKALLTAETPHVRPHKVIPSPGSGLSASTANQKHLVSTSPKAPPSTEATDPRRQTFTTHNLTSSSPDFGLAVSNATQRQTVLTSPKARPTKTIDLIRRHMLTSRKVASYPSAMQLPANYQRQPLHTSSKATPPTGTSDQRPPPSHKITSCPDSGLSVSTFNQRQSVFTSLKAPPTKTTDPRQTVISRKATSSPSSTKSIQLPAADQRQTVLTSPKAPSPAKTTDLRQMLTSHRALSSPDSGLSVSTAGSDESKKVANETLVVQPANGVLPIIDSPIESSKKETKTEPVVEDKLPDLMVAKGVSKTTSSDESLLSPRCSTLATKPPVLVVAKIDSTTSSSCQRSLSTPRSQCNKTTLDETQQCLLAAEVDPTPSGSYRQSLSILFINSQYKTTLNGNPVDFAATKVDSATSSSGSSQQTVSTPPTLDEKPPDLLATKVESATSSSGSSQQGLSTPRCSSTTLDGQPPVLASAKIDSTQLGGDQQRKRKRKRKKVQTEKLLDMLNTFAEGVLPTGDRSVTEGQQGSSENKMVFDALKVTKDMSVVLDNLKVTKDQSLVLDNLKVTKDQSQTDDPSMTVGLQGSSESEVLPDTMKVTKDQTPTNDLSATMPLEESSDNKIQTEPHHNMDETEQMDGIVASKQDRELGDRLLPIPEGVKPTPGGIVFPEKKKKTRRRRRSHHRKSGGSQEPMQEYEKKIGDVGGSEKVQVERGTQMQEGGCVSQEAAKKISEIDVPSKSNAEEGMERTCVEQGTQMEENGCGMQEAAKKICDVDVDVLEKTHTMETRTCVEQVVQTEKDGHGGVHKLVASDTDGSHDGDDDAQLESDVRQLGSAFIPMVAEKIDDSVPSIRQEKCSDAGLKSGPSGNPVVASSDRVSQSIGGQVSDAAPELTHDDRYTSSDTPSSRHHGSLSDGVELRHGDVRCSSSKVAFSPNSSRHCLLSDVPALRLGDGRQTSSYESVRRLLSKSSIVRRSPRKDRDDKVSLSMDIKKRFR